MSNPLTELRHALGRVRRKMTASSIASQEVNAAISVNFTNSAPILKPGVIVIHDISYKLNPSFYKTTHGKLAKWWHRFNYAWCARLHVPILTDTYYSKKTIVDNYHVNENRIRVIGCGWQHIKRVIEDNNTLAKYGLTEGQYYFTLGSLSERKNTSWIFKTAQRIPDETFVVGGGFAKNSTLDKSDIPNNVKLIGYISDQEMKSLMMHCKAFVFPSLFEGLGIPPLEAMSVGAPVVSSNASCLPEIYEDAATYIDPYMYPNKIEIINDKSKSQRVLEKYSWEKSALDMLDFIRIIQER